jgi:Fe-S oxidoreductase
MQEGGMVPAELRAPLGGLRVEGNPWEGKRDQRGAWAEDLAIPAYAQELEHLLFTCCTHVYDGRFKKVLRQIAALLRKGEVSFGILGSDESCCGDQAHKCGAYDTYSRLAKSNAKVFQKRGVSKVIATSPHCMNIFEKYFDGVSQSEHYTQVFDRLISQGLLEPTREVPLKVTYHDPCYLGRHNGVYEPPRRVLQAIPGLEYIEMPRNRSKSLCCGGGGGGLWQEVPVERRFSVLRIQEARASGAKVIATACPYCTIMLEDGLKALGIEEEELRVMEVAELLHRAIE